MKTFFDMNPASQANALMERREEGKLVHARRVAHGLARWIVSGMMQPCVTTREHFAMLALSDGELTSLAEIHGVWPDLREYVVHETRLTLLK